MVRKILAGLITLASIVIVISFFLPWAKINVSVVGVSKQLTSVSEKKLQGSPVADKMVKKMQEITDAMSSFGDIDIKTTVPGYKIPGMVNNKTSKVALSATEILFKSTSGLDQKVYLVYLLPLLGIVCGILAITGLKNRACIIILLVISGIVESRGSIPYLRQTWQVWP